MDRLAAALGTCAAREHHDDVLDLPGVPGSATRREYAQPGDWSAVPTPPSVAGVGHGSEPPWLIHLTGSTRAASSVSRTRTVAMGALRVNRGRCCARSARSGASVAEISATPDVLNCRVWSPYRWPRLRTRAGRDFRVVTATPAATSTARPSTKATRCHAGLPPSSAPARPISKANSTSRNGGNHRLIAVPPSAGEQPSARTLPAPALGRYAPVRSCRRSCRSPRTDLGTSRYCL